jgi:3-methyladenine DNA glycosylase Tag
MMWDLASYYDSELNWTISVLTKTNANRKKFKQFLLDKVSEMPDAQAEELTVYTFDKF